MTITKPEPKTPMEIAIRHFGSEMKLAEAIGVSQTAVNKAKRRLELGGRISAEMAVAIEQATEGTVTRSEFRPDLWTATEAAA